MPRPKPRHGVLLAALLAVADPASATDPLVTDPVGDQSGLSCWVLVTSCPQLYTTAYEPAADLLEADITNTTSDLTVSIKVADLDSPGADPQFGGDDDAVMHSFSFTVDGVSVSGNTTRTFDHSKHSAYLNVGGVPVVDGTPAVTYDGATDTVSISVSFDAVNRVLGALCASCSLGSGSTLTGFSLGASFGTYIHQDPLGMIVYSGLGGSDHAATTDTYTVS